jgi:hypothetical protein
MIVIIIIIIIIIIKITIIIIIIIFMITIIIVIMIIIVIYYDYCNYDLPLLFTLKSTVFFISTRWCQPLISLDSKVSVLTAGIYKCFLKLLPMSLNLTSVLKMIKRFTVADIRFVAFLSCSLF